jgi:biopolymer transport protein ExbD
LDAAASLVPKGRPQKKAYFRADFAVPAGQAIDLLHKLYAIGFTKIGIVGEETEKD